MKTPIAGWTTERISTTVLYAIIGLVTVVFAAFFLVGFDMEQPDVPGFNAPLLTGTLIGLMWLLLVVAAIAFGMSVIRGYKTRGKEGKVVNAIPAARISYASLGTMVVLLILSFAFAPTDAILINGESFTDGFWLRVSEMFVFTSIVLIVIAAGAVIFGFTRYQRKK